MVDYLIIGAQKCGTSSLYKYLLQHPKIDRAAAKELNFFDKSFHKGTGWYENQFKHGRFVRRLLGMLAGEATPNYIFNPVVPQRVFDSYPDMKLITILRNPVDRAYSHFQQHYREGLETLDFETALDAEHEELHKDLGKNGLPADTAPRIFPYQKRGIYVDQLERWHSVFPKEQLLILFFEDFKKEPAETTRKVTGFLGLKPHDVKINRVHNSGGSYEPMKPETRERLTELFRPHNLRLSEYLCRELPWV
jgi:hypothetical protein